MTYDKYRTWRIPRGAVPVGFTRPSLEEQVLMDLSGTNDEIEKLEILDSYAAYCKRAYQQDFVGATAQFVGQQLGGILESVFLSRLPEVYTGHRRRASKAE